MRLLRPTDFRFFHGLLRRGARGDSWLLSIALLVGVVSIAGAQPVTNWSRTSNLRGELHFVNGTRQGLELSTPCALSLPGRELTVLAKPEDFTASASSICGPKWGASADDVYAYINQPWQRRGLCHLDLSTGAVQLLIPSGKWKHPGAAGGIYYSTLPDGTEKAHEAPGVAYGAWMYAFARRTQTLYAVIDYNVALGVPGWNLDPDSLDLPVWVEARVREKLSLDSLSGTFALWSDLMTIDSTKQVTFLRELKQDARGLAVSPDEDYVARTGDDGTHIYDLSTGEFLVLPDPKGVNIMSPVFSPNGRTLAALGRRSDPERGGITGVYLMKVPEFAEFVRLREIPDGTPLDICWSPDGVWIMVQVEAPRRRGHWGDLVAIEVATNIRVDIDRPYKVNGKPDPRYYPDGGIDWIE